MKMNCKSFTVIFGLESECTFSVQGKQMPLAIRQKLMMIIAFYFPMRD